MPPTRRTPSPLMSRSQRFTERSTHRAGRRGRAGAPTAERLSPVITTMNGGTTPLLPGYRIKILDGNHLPGSEHRIKELRTMGAAALPGHTLVVLDPQLMLVIDAFPCEDGHVQERSLLGQVEATVQPKDLWIDDRNFCTTGFLFGIARREGFFLVRQHAATLTYTLVGKRKDRGRVETGRVFEQTLRATNDAGEVLFLRRVTVVLDKPTRRWRHRAPPADQCAGQARPCARSG